MRQNSFANARKAIVASSAAAFVLASAYAVACEKHTGTTTTTSPTTSTSTSGSTSTNTNTNTSSGTTTTSGSPIHLVGVNLASAEFGSHTLPGTYGKEYIYPGEANFKRHADLGLKLIRLPFRWERIQPKLGTALNEAEVARMVQALDYAHKYNLKVILDMHNYYRYYGKLIASTDVPISQFANTWKMITQKVVNHPAVYGYGLMSEPHSTNGQWPQAALAASKAIRAVDKNRWIFVAGDRWSNSYYWASYNTKLISDPWMRDNNNKLVYEAHMYMDHDFSGSYKNTSETFASDLGVKRVKPFVDWLKANNLRGYIGEHGVPYWSPSGMVAMDKMLAYLNQNCVPSTYWAGGPWWGEYKLSLDSKSGAPRPQIDVLKKHTGYKACTTIGPAK